MQLVNISKPPMEVKNMKKTIAMLLTLAMTIGLLSGCAGVPVAIEFPKNETVKEEVN